MILINTLVAVAVLILSSEIFKKKVFAQELT